MTGNTNKQNTRYVLVGFIIVFTILALSAFSHQGQKDAIGSQANKRPSIFWYWKKFFQDLKQKRDQLLPPSKPSPPPVSLPPTTPLCAGKTSVSCSQLAASFTSGSAACRPNTTGYDVSTCSVVPGKMEMVKPAQRDPQRWQTARCNDGSPFAFEVQLSKSQPHDWVIWLEGGGFCDDNAKSCAGGRGRHGTTLPEKDRALVNMAKTGGIFNRNSAANPDFYSANLIFAQYCSSDAWSGATSQRRKTSGDPVNGWYFSGRLNVRAMLETLIQRYGLDDGNPQTNVLFSGSSSGGTGVHVNADTLAELLPQTAKAGRLKLVNDAGDIPDFDNPNYRPGDASVPVREVIMAAYTFWGSQHNALCEAALKKQGQDPRRCFFAFVNYPFIADPSPKGLGLPLLIQTSSVDKFALDLHGITNPTRDAAAIKQWRQTMLSSLKGFAWVFSSGASPYHTILTSDGNNPGWNMGPAGKTFREVLGRFWLNGKPERVIFGNP